MSKRTSATVTMDRAGGIVVPRAILDAVDFTPGTLLRVSVTGGRIVVEPEPPPAKTDVKDERRRVSTD